MCQKFHVRFQLPLMCKGELSTAITQLMYRCLWSVWKWQKGNKEIASPFTCCPVNREYSWKKSQVEKQKNKTKIKLCLATCKNRLSVYVDEDRLESFMTKVPIIQKPVHWFAEQINGLVSIRQEPPSWKS